MPGGSANHQAPFEALWRCQMSELDWLTLDRILLVLGGGGIVGFVQWLYHAHSKKQHTQIVSANEAYELATKMAEGRAEVEIVALRKAANALEKQNNELKRRAASRQSEQSAARSNREQEIAREHAYLDGAQDQFGKQLGVMRKLVDGGWSSNVASAVLDQLEAAQQDISRRREELWRELLGPHHGTSDDSNHADNDQQLHS